MAAVARLEPYRRHHRCGRERERHDARSRNHVRSTAVFHPGVRGSEMNDVALFGPRLTSDGVTFRLWAPAARQVELLIDRSSDKTAALPMQRGAGGWYASAVAGAGAGTLYRFRIAGALAVPDPA